VQLAFFMPKGVIMSQEKDLAAGKPDKSAGRVIDWESMEPDWRAGIKSVLQLSKEHRVSRAAILKHFDKLGIERDLSAKIKAKAEALVTQAAVTQSVTQERLRATESAIVEANAEAVATVQLAHRSDIQRSRSLVMKLLHEVEATTDQSGLFAQLGELMRAQDEKGIDKLNDLYQKVVGLSGRVDNMKKLSDSLKILIGLEREAFNIGAEKSLGQTLDDFLDAIADA